MWRLSILLLFAFTAGLMADIEDELKECADQADLDGLMERMKAGQPEADTVCPVVLDLMECFENAIKKAVGFSMADLAKMAPDSDVSRGATIFINIRDVVSDLCTEGTELNEAYKENEECLEAMDVSPDECRTIAHATYESYKEFEDAVQEEAGENSRRDNRECMVQAYQSACTAVMINDKCGKAAFDLYQTLVKRSTVFSNALCSQEDLETLKTKFVDSMDLGEAESDLFRLAFDLRRRRK